MIVFYSDKEFGQHGIIIRVVRCYSNTLLRWYLATTHNFWIRSPLLHTCFIYKKIFRLVMITRGLTGRANPPCKRNLIQSIHAPKWIRYSLPSLSWYIHARSSWKTLWMCCFWSSLDQLRTFSKLGYVSTFVVSNMNSYPSLSLLFHSCWESVRHKGITSN